MSTLTIKVEGARSANNAVLVKGLEAVVEKALRRSGVEFDNLYAEIELEAADEPA